MNETPRYYKNKYGLFMRIGEFRMFIWELRSWKEISVLRNIKNLDKNY